MECNNLAPCINDKECMCFADSDSPDPQNDQFCGYVGADGTTVFPCAPNCCNKGRGCPGQCAGVEPKRPDYIRDVKERVVHSLTIATPEERLDFFEKVVKILIALLIISSLSLFISA